MRTSDFDYHLPSELIAQTPLEPRDHSRLMVLNRLDGAIQHRRFVDILDYLQAGDVLVFNDSRVIPARLQGRCLRQAQGKRADTGGKAEILLLRRLDTCVWETLVKPGKALCAGARVAIADGLEAEVVAEVVSVMHNGLRVMKFSDEALLPKLGKVPLPPYIHVPLSDPERYQTVYATTDGSAAAPTAGLHFTPALLAKIKQKGVHCLFATLHIGLDTFSPVREADPLKHTIHKEYGVVTRAVIDRLALAKKEGRRIIAVGTTSARILEQVAQVSPLQAFEGWVSLFILPGYQFKMVDAMISNFHLPKSTLLMLVTAFVGREQITRAYDEAIAQRYRFYSFGDAMLVS